MDFYRRTSGQHPGNFNAANGRCPKRAVLYTIFDVWLPMAIPAQRGCLKNPSRVIIPEKSMINPDYPGAVISGTLRRPGAG